MMVMVEMWGEKVKWVSKVSPRILGALSRGTMELSIEIWGWSLDWWLSEVKRVTEDLVGAMERLWEEDQLVMEERSLFRMDVDSGIELEEWKAVKSSGLGGEGRGLVVVAIRDVKVKKDWGDNRSMGDAKIDFAGAGERE